MTLRQRPEDSSVWFATLVAAPMACGVVSTAIVGVVSGAGAGAVVALAVLPFAYFFAVFHAILLGLPTYLALRARGWANLTSALASGVVIGVLPIGSLLVSADISRGAWPASLGVVGFLAANGAAAGAAFWAAIRCWPGNQAQDVDTEVFA